MYLRASQVRQTLGAFGTGPSLSPNNPFDDPGGGTADDVALKAALIECGTKTLLGVAMGGGADAAAGCAWGKLRDIVMAMPEAEAILVTIASSSCSDAMMLLGLSPDNAALACALGSNVWTKVQHLAYEELTAYRAGRTGREERRVEDGGGYVIRTEGMPPYVSCSSNEPPGPTVFGPVGDLGFRCPAGTGGIPAAPHDEAAISFQTRKQPLYMQRGEYARTDTVTTDKEKTEAEGEAWYSSPWLWVGLGVAALGGFFYWRYTKKG